MFVNSLNCTLEKVHLMCKNLRFEKLQDPNNEWLEQICNLQLSLEEQIPFLVSAVEVHPSFFKNFIEIFIILERIVDSSYPESNIQIRPFGLSATQLACKGGQLDFFLDFDVLPKPTDEILKKIHGILNDENCTLFSNAYIFSEKIIKFIHVSGICCNISLDCPFDVLISEIIRFYVRFDERVEPYLMLLILWMEKQELFGQTQLAPVSLIFLAIFYLQLDKIKLLPSVSYLQALSSSKHVIGDWNVSFIEDKEFVSFIRNDEPSVFHLMRGFFSYYSKLDFGIYVISPFLGKTILKSHFARPALLPEELSLYKLNLQQSFEKFDFKKFVCLQDIFRHNFNMCFSMTKDSLIKFQNHCAKALEICDDEIMENRGCDNPSYFFRNLLKPFKKELTKENAIHIYLGEGMVFDGEVDSNEVKLRNLWSKRIWTFLLTVLTKVMRCTINCEPDDDISDNWKLETTRLVKCEMTHDLLNSEKRKLASQLFDFPKKMSALMKEEYISDYLHDSVFKTVESCPLKFNISFTCKERPTYVSMNLTSLEIDEGKDGLLKETFSCLQDVFPKWLRMALNIEEPFD